MARKAQQGAIVTGKAGRGKVHKAMKSAAAIDATESAKIKKPRKQLVKNAKFGNKDVLVRVPRPTISKRDPCKTKASNYLLIQEI